MWWCCGKSSKEAPGCKFSKHSTQEEEEENEDNNYGSEGNKLIRCMCCKELGHGIEICPRDPNFKTKVDNDKEHERINKISDYKKLFGDTVVQTTHMLKKCVLIPGTEIKKQDVANRTFKRGVMQFEDFNYSSFNSYILVEGKGIEKDLDFNFNTKKNSNLKKGNF